MINTQDNQVFSVSVIKYNTMKRREIDVPHKIQPGKSRDYWFGLCEVAHTRSRVSGAIHPVENLVQETANSNRGGLT